MRVSKHRRVISASERIVAAGENVFDDVGDLGDVEPAVDENFEDDALGDQLDDLEDNLEDIQDTVEDVEEDDTVIDIDNNIVDHLIAECDNCKGIFISAMIVSDQDVDSINGICPLCNKDTSQSLKWVVKKYPEESPF